MRAQLSNRDYELISAYIDDQLAPADQRRLEERLRANPDLQAALDEMSRTRALLRQAPRRRAPRSFALTPAMVGNTGPGRRRGFSFNFFPALSFASALATLALVATMVFSSLPGLSGATMSASAPPTDNGRAADRQTLSSNAAPQATAAAESQAQGLAAPEAPGAPAAGAAAKQADSGAPVIVWNGTGMGGGPAPEGRGGGGGGGQGPDLGDLLGPAGNAPQAGAGGYGMGGGGGASGPSIVIPPQGADTLPTSSPQVQSAAPAQSSPALEGNGPILGVPSGSEGGEIIEQKVIMGSAVDQPGETAQPSDAYQPGVSATLFGLPRLVALQILLGLLAVVTGAAALLTRRRWGG